MTFKEISQFIKVQYHCLTKTINLSIFKKDDDHRPCSLDMVNGKTRHFCSCGYLNKGTTWEELMKSLGIAGHEYTK